MFTRSGFPCVMAFAARSAHAGASGGGLAPWLALGLPPAGLPQHPQRRAQLLVELRPPFAGALERAAFVLGPTPLGRLQPPVSVGDSSGTGRAEPGAGQALLHGSLRF